MFTLGCHRSGTSLVAGVLGEFLEEVNPGSKLKTSWLENNLDNPNGFHESKPLMETNKELLHLIGCNWERPYLVRPDWSQLESYINIKQLRNRLKQWLTGIAWVDKDPRLCITREAYLHIFLKDVDAIAVVRDPISVANSLFMRNGLKLETGLGLWLTYNYFLFNARCASPKATLIYNEIGNKADTFSEKIVSGLNPKILGLERSGKSYDQTIELLHRKFKKHFSPALQRSDQALSASLLTHTDLTRTVKSAYKSLLEPEALNNPTGLATIFKQSFHQSFDILQDLFPHQFSEKTLAERKPSARAYRMISLAAEKIKSLQSKD